MTTLTLVAGMIPMAIGTGPGAEERRAVAVVVIGGQSLCLLLTLIVTPVAYSLLDDLGATAWWRALAERAREATEPMRRALRVIPGGRSASEQPRLVEESSLARDRRGREIEIGAKSGD
jgi:hypothetical protein